MVRQTLHNQDGFTLIELLVVIAIIAILASVVLGAVKSGVNKANYTRVGQDFDSITKAANLYLNDNQNNWAPEVGPGVAPAFVPKYLPQWPSPPCAGYYYDWDNWSSGNDVRIDLRKKSDNSIIFTKCVHQGAGASACSDISNASPQTFICQ